MLPKAFQDMLRAVRHALEEAYVYVALLTGMHKVASSAFYVELNRLSNSVLTALGAPA